MIAEKPVRTENHEFECLGPYFMRLPHQKLVESIIHHTILEPEGATQDAYVLGFPFWDGKFLSKFKKMSKLGPFFRREHPLGESLDDRVCSSE